MRICRICNNPESETRKFRSKRNICLICFGEYMKTYRKDNRDKLNAQIKTWKTNNKSKPVTLLQRLKSLASKAKLDKSVVANLLSLWESQSARCAFTAIPMELSGENAVALSYKNDGKDLVLVCEWVRRAIGTMPTNEFKKCLDQLDDVRNLRLKTKYQQRMIVPTDIEGMFLHSISEWLRDSYWLYQIGVTIERTRLIIRLPEIQVAPVASDITVVTTMQDDRDTWWFTRTIEVEDGDVVVRGRPSRNSSKNVTLFSCPLAAPDSLERLMRVVAGIIESAIPGVSPVVLTFNYEVSKHEP